MTRGALAPGTVLVLLALAVAACTGPVDGAAPEGSLASPSSATPIDASVDPGTGTLRFALSRDPTSLDPALTVTTEDAIVVDALFDSLTRLGRDLVPRPAAASSWRSSSDATSFTFLLDPRGRWHDGTPVVAADVVRGLRRVVDPEVGSPHHELLRTVVGYDEARAGGAPLSGVVALDPRTVRVELTRPLPELPGILAAPALAPAPPVAASAPAAQSQDPIGNGPFRLASEWVHNDAVRLQPAPDVARPGQLDEVVFQVYAGDADRRAQWAVFEGGRLDVAAVPAGERPAARELLGTAGQGIGPGVLDGLTSTVAHLQIDPRVAPLDDARVRDAVALVLDREAVAATITRDARVAARTYVPEVVDEEAAICLSCRTDLARARGLVADVVADREGPLPPIRVAVPEGAVDEAIGERLVAGLGRVGLTARLEVRPLDEHIAAVEGTSPPGVARLGWQAAWPDASAYLDPLADEWVQLLEEAQAGAPESAPEPSSPPPSPSEPSSPGTPSAAPSQPPSSEPSASAAPAVPASGGTASADPAEQDGPAEEPTVDAAPDLPTTAAQLREAVALARATANPTARGAAWRQVERLVLEAGLVAPVLHYRHPWAVAEGVEGLVVTPLGTVDLAEVTLRR